MTNIYDKINDMEFDTESIELNDIERARILKSAKSYAKKKSNSKLIATAAALMLVAGLMTPQVRAEVMKITTDIKVSLMDVIGASPDSYKYVTELNKPVAVGETDFVIGNIAFEDDRVYINALRDSEGTDEDLMDSGADLYKIVINGQSYRSMASSGYRRFLEDGKTITDVRMHQFSNTFPTLENTDVDLYFKDEVGSEVITIKADTNIVNEENIIFAKDKELENGVLVTLVKLNPITMTANIKNLDPELIYQLKGSTNDGRTFLLSQRLSENDDFTFLYDHESSDLTLDEIKDANEITFYLGSANRFDASGIESDEQYETVAKFTYKK